ncbi:hypothetical protein ACOCGD_003433 [Vibrio cholerae]
MILMEISDDLIEQYQKLLDLENRLFKLVAKPSVKLGVTETITPEIRKVEIELHVAKVAYQESLINTAKATIENHLKQSA